MAEARLNAKKEEPQKPYRQILLAELSSGLDETPTASLGLAALLALRRTGRQFQSTADGGHVDAGA